MASSSTAGCISLASDVITMQSHLNMVYSAKTLIITHSGVNACPLGTAENIIG